MLKPRLNKGKVLKIGWAIIGSTCLLVWLGLMALPITPGAGFMANGFKVWLDSDPVYLEAWAEYKLALSIATVTLLPLSAFSIFKMDRAK